jgi:uncharacterized protein (TIGR00304 family)
MRMNRYLILAIVLAICGIVLLGYSVASGEGTAGVVVFIPVFYGSGLFAFLGVLCIMAGLFLGFFGIAKGLGEAREFEDTRESQSPQPTRPRTQKSIKGGGVVLIGPIPVIFGSDAKTAIVLVVLAIILIIAVAILFYL